MSLSELDIKKEHTLNKRYDFLRRSLTSYYVKCMNVEENQHKNFPVPFEDYAQMMKFYENVYYKFLREEYRNDNR